MILAKELLMGRQVEFPLTEQLLDNLCVLHAAVNQIRRAYGKPMTVTSGYRPGRFNTAAGGAKGSAHLVCLAADFADVDGSLATWCLANLWRLQAAGLWLEDPTHTKGWVHLQARDPGTGPTQGVFKP